MDPINGSETSLENRRRCGRCFRRAKDVPERTGTSSAFGVETRTSIRVMVGGCLHCTWFPSANMWVIIAEGEKRALAFGSALIKLGLKSGKDMLGIMLITSLLGTNQIWLVSRTTFLLFLSMSLATICSRTHL
jgi:hypothetical protein